MNWRMSAIGHCLGGTTVLDKLRGQLGFAGKISNASVLAGADDPAPDRAIPF